MIISEEFFQGTHENPFSYEGSQWVLVQTTRVANIIGPDDVYPARQTSNALARETVYFDYEALEPSPLCDTWPMLHIAWAPNEQSFGDTYSYRPKTHDERFEDGIAWAAMVAEAHSAPRDILDAIASKRPNVKS